MKLGLWAACRTITLSCLVLPQLFFPSFCVVLANPLLPGAPPPLRWLLHRSQMHLSISTSPVGRPAARTASRRRRCISTISLGSIIFFGCSALHLAFYPPQFDVGISSCLDATRRSSDGWVVEVFSPPTFCFESSSLSHRSSLSALNHRLLFVLPLENCKNFKNLHISQHLLHLSFGCSKFRIRAHHISASST